MPFFQPSTPKTFAQTLKYKDFNFLWSPGEKTPFLYVRKLLPGHYIKLNLLNSKSVQDIKYYDIPFTGIYSKISEEEQVLRLQQRLEQAVERQLIGQKS